MGSEKGVSQGFLKVRAGWWRMVLLIERWSTIENMKTSVRMHYIGDFSVTGRAATGVDVGIISIYYGWWLWLYEWRRFVQGKITEKEHRWVRGWILGNTRVSGAQMKRHLWSHLRSSGHEGRRGTRRKSNIFMEDTFHGFILWGVKFHPGYSSVDIWQEFYLAIYWDYYTIDKIRFSGIVEAEKGLGS